MELEEPFNYSYSVELAENKPGESDVAFGRKP